jgi:ribosomal protein S27E
MGFTVDIPGKEPGSNVISLEVARNSARSLRVKEECPCMRIAIDIESTTVHCRDCGKDLNPVVWIARLADRWRYLTDRIEQMNALKAEIELKNRVKCRGCGVFTKVVR